MKVPVVLVDAANLLFRSHYSHAALSTRDGFPTGAIYGFLTAIQAIQRHFGSVDIVVCWEGDGVTSGTGRNQRTWRKSLAYVGQVYKANREHNEETARARQQIPKIFEALNILQIFQISVPQLEADDVIGVSVAKLRQDRTVNGIFILSNDQDFYQCLDGNHVRILRSKDGKMVYTDEDAVYAEAHVYPQDWAKFRALSGDASDNYKALGGIGPVKAVKLLNDGVDPSVPKFADLPEEIRAEYASLESSWDKVHLCYHLAFIPTTWQYAKFPAASRERLRTAIKDLVIRRHRRFTADGIRDAVLKITALFADLEMPTLLATRGRFFHGVDIT